MGIVREIANGITIARGDCLDVLPKIPRGGVVDMILCDLPFGTTRNAWDEKIPLAALWEQYLEVCKPNAAIVLFSQQPFTAELINSRRDLFRYEWIWKKDISTGFLNAKKMPMKIHENILVFYQSLPTYNPQMGKGTPYISKSSESSLSPNYGDFGFTVTVNDGTRYPSDVIEYQTEKGMHPTQKPVKLLEYLIRTYTNPGEVVLDSCMGSGSTGVACINTERKFIGIEKSNDFFSVAEKRIDEALSQPRLFGEVF